MRCTLHRVAELPCRGQRAVEVRTASVESSTRTRSCGRLKRSVPLERRVIDDVERHAAVAVELVADERLVQRQPRAAAHQPGQRRRDVEAIRARVAPAIAGLEAAVDAIQQTRLLPPTAPVAPAATWCVLNRPPRYITSSGAHRLRLLADDVDAAADRAAAVEDGARSLQHLDRLDVVGLRGVAVAVAAHAVEEHHVEAVAIGDRRTPESCTARRRRTSGTTGHPTRCAARRQRCSVPAGRSVPAGSMLTCAGTSMLLTGSRVAVALPAAAVTVTDGVHASHRERQRRPPACRREGRRCARRSRSRAWLRRPRSCRRPSPVNR